MDADRASTAARVQGGVLRQEGVQDSRGGSYQVHQNGHTSTEYNLEGPTILYPIGSAFIGAGIATLVAGLGWVARALAEILVGARLDGPAAVVWSGLVLVAVVSSISVVPRLLKR